MRRSSFSSTSRYSSRGRPGCCCRAGGSGRARPSSTSARSCRRAVRGVTDSSWPVSSASTTGEASAVSFCASRDSVSSARIRLRLSAASARAAADRPGPAGRSRPGPAARRSPPGRPARRVRQAGARCRRGGSARWAERLSASRACASASCSDGPIPTATSSPIPSAVLAAAANGGSPAAASDALVPRIRNVCSPAWPTVACTRCASRTRNRCTVSCRSWTACRGAGRRRARPQRGHLGDRDGELGRGQHVLARQQRRDLEPGPDGLVGRTQPDHRDAGLGQPDGYRLHARERRSRLAEPPQPLVERRDGRRARGLLVHVRAVGGQAGVGQPGGDLVAAQPVIARRAGLVPLPAGPLQRRVQRRAAELDAGGRAGQDAGPAGVVERDAAGEQ